MIEHSTEYLAVSRNRLIKIMLLMFLMGAAAGLLAGYLLWTPDEERSPRQRPPQDPTIREAVA